MTETQAKLIALQHVMHSGVGSRRPTSIGNTSPTDAALIDCAIEILEAELGAKASQYQNEVRWQKLVNKHAAILDIPNAPKVRTVFNGTDPDREMYDLFLGDRLCGTFDAATITPLANAIGRALGQYKNVGDEEAIRA